jgi:transposase-like protein
MNIRPQGVIGMKELLHVGETCPNPECPRHGISCPETIIKFGHSKAGRQRYKCQVCDKTFTSTTGTVFYRRRTSPEEILNALGQLAEGARISSVSRTTGHKEETISGWLVAASSQTKQLDEGLLADYHLSEGQLDGLWSYVGNKGEKKGLRRNG